MKRGVIVAILLALLGGCALPGTENPEGTVDPRDRYIEVALTCEYDPCPPGIVKPAEGVTLELKTPATSEQSAALDHTMKLWNATCPAHPLTFDAGEAVMEYYFVDEAELADVLPIYVEGNVGLFTYDWDSNNVITGSIVAIANELEGTELIHFVLEETTQAMGLINDVSDPTSIFDGGVGRVTEYSALDRLTIAQHCDDGVIPGMSESDLP